MSGQGQYSEALEDEELDQSKSQPRSLHLGNWTIWWIVGLVSSTVFFFPKNPSIVQANKRQPFGPCIMTHLIAAGIISFVCLWNIFHTPSHGPTYCLIHRWLGRVGMIASLIGVYFGLISAWWERYNDELLGLAIGLSVVACLQSYYTVFGYLAIRKAIACHDDGDDEGYQENVALHRSRMIGLWVSCLGPAWFRVPQMLGAPADSYLMFLGMIPTFFFVPLVERAMKRKTWC